MAGTATTARADELDGLIRDSRLPLMFQAHRPDFSVADAKVRIATGGIIRTQVWKGLKDGRRFAGLIRPDGNLILFSFNPFETTTNPPAILGGWHLDTAYGHLIRTDIGIRTKADDEAPDLEVSGSGEAITFVRRQKRGLFGGGPEVVNTIHLTFNPHLGYIVDATADVTRLNGPTEIETARLAPPGRCRMWPGEAAVLRVIGTSVGGGFDGIVNIPAEWERHSGTNNPLTCRDGGFAAMTDSDGYFSPAVTVSGADVRLRMNPLDGSVSIMSPVGPRARQLVMRHRYLYLPGMVTGVVLERLNLRHAKDKAIVLRLDRKEELEDQPLPLTINARGLMGPGLVLTTNLARSGRLSLVVTGAVHPVGPPVLLEPRTRYEVSAYAHVVTKPRAGSPEPAAFLTTRLFTWPDTNATGAVVRRTDVAKYVPPPPSKAAPKKDPKKPDPDGGSRGDAATGNDPNPAADEGSDFAAEEKKDEKPKEEPKPNDGQWKKVMLEFATADAEVCAEVGFHATNGYAYFDDFRFLKLGKLTNAPGRGGTNAPPRGGTNGPPRAGPGGESAGPDGENPGPRRRRRPQ